MKGQMANVSRNTENLRKSEGDARNKKHSNKVTLMDSPVDYSQVKNQ